MKKPRRPLHQAHSLRVTPKRPKVFEKLAVNPSWETRSLFSADKPHIPIPFGPSITDMPEYKAHLNDAFKEMNLTVEEAKKKYFRPDLEPEPRRRKGGKMGLTYQLTTFRNPWLEKHFKWVRDEDPEEELKRKCASYVGLSWFQPGMKDFPVIDSISCGYNTGYSIYPVVTKRNPLGVRIHRQVRPIERRICEDEDGPTVTAFAQLLYTKIHNIGKLISDKGIISWKRHAQVIRKTLETSARFPNSEAKRRTVNSAFVTNLELKSDIAFDKTDAKVMYFLGLNPFLFSATKLHNSVSPEDEPNNLSIYYNRSGMRYNREGEQYFPRQGAIIYQVKDYRNKDKVAFRLEFRRAGQKSVRTLYNGLLPDDLELSRIYEEDLRVPSVPTALFNSQMDANLKRLEKLNRPITVRPGTKPKGDWWKGLPQFPDHPENRAERDRCAEMILMWWERTKVEAKIKHPSKNGRVPNARSTWLRERKDHLTRWHLDYCRNKGIDVLAILRRFRLDASAGYPNAHHGMVPALRKARRNAWKFKAYLAELDCRKFEQPDYDDRDEEEDDTLSPSDKGESVEQLPSLTTAIFPSPSPMTQQRATQGGAKTYRLRGSIMRSVSDADSGDGDGRAGKGPKAHRAGEAGSGTDPSVGHPGKPRASGRSPKAKGENSWLGLWGEGSKPGEG